MLILNPQDIKYCRLAYNNTCLDKTYPGIAYQKLFFIPVTSFAKIHLKKAEAICRQFCQQEQPLTSIIIKEEDRISVWVEAPDLNLIKLKIDKDLEPKKINPNQSNWISIKWLTLILPFLF